MILRTHTDVLNYLVEAHNLQSYLELGINIPANNFDKIKVPVKVGIDPKCNQYFSKGYSILKMSSDDFFLDPEEENFPPFDLIFIDGDHTYEQVKRDFENSVDCLNKNGFIVIHDTVPLHEIDTLVPRQTKRWNGDVYKFGLELRNYTGIDYYTLAFDSGITVIQVKGAVLSKNLENKHTWTTYLTNKSLLNIVSSNTFAAKQNILT